jgi:hypothetical protein
MTTDPRRYGGLAVICQAFGWPVDLSDGIVASWAASSPSSAISEQPSAQERRGAGILLEEPSIPAWWIPSL